MPGIYSSHSERSKFCHVRSVRMWILVIVLIAAIGGAIAGIVIATKKKDTGSSGSSTNSTTDVPTINSTTVVPTTPTKPPPPPFVYVNCQPETQNPNKDECNRRGCQWSDSPMKDTPQCFFGPGYGYKLDGKVETKDKIDSFTLIRKNGTSMYGEEFDRVKGQTTYLTDRSLRIKFEDESNKRYEVPILDPQPTAKATEKRDYTIEYFDDPQFGFRIVRKSTNTVIFEANVPGMVFSDQFIQITTRLASENIYGLGERRTDHYRHRLNTNVTMFARDVGTTENQNLYGTHPFYMVVESDGNAHGVFFLNSNAMQVSLQTPRSATFRTIGGILDIFVFAGPTPEEVVQQYLEVIGTPRIPPYWSLGFQISRWGYYTVNNTIEVEDRNTAAGIPWDVQTFDIDYMEDHRIFTYDPKGFQELPYLVKRLHDQHRKLVLIMDPAVASNKTQVGDYPALIDGMNRGIFIMYNGSILEGKVWPGLTYYPDFTHPDIANYWAKHSEVDLIDKGVAFDGMWLDMNEPSCFKDGSLNGCSNSSLNYPPFTAGVLGSEKDGRIFEKTICMDSDHHLGLHYNLHSLYGYFHSKSTYEALLQVTPGKRPFIYSRSTYPGSGRYASHWLGDNDSTWSQLRISIQGMLSFNIFGIPHVGADICGFSGNTTDELCVRWTQAGAFYPFSRNHNMLDARDQDPAAFVNETMEGCKQALVTRYQLLPYLYTLFYEANTEGGTVARPLVHEFPEDSATWDIDFQFLWGKALLISPVVYENETTVNAYFPKAIWYDFYEGVPLNATGTNLTLDAPLNKVILHVRGGHILPMQTPGLTTFESREKPMQLLVAPNENGEAKGTLFFDDGESLDTIKEKNYLLSTFSLNKVDNTTASLDIKPETDGYAKAKNLKFDKIRIFNQRKPSKVTLNNETVSYTYHHQPKVLEIQTSIAINAKSTIKITF